MCSNVFARSPTHSVHRCVQYETNLETLYTPISSQASTDRAHLLTLFPDRSADLFQFHQAIAMPAYGETIIFVRSLDGEGSGANASGSSSDVLDPLMMGEVRRLCDSILELKARVSKQAS